MSTQGFSGVVKEHKPLVAVVGFTASGKTDVALEIARKYGGEIIAADAITVYEKFDIGSAKPIKQELSEIPHHMIDVTKADEQMSASKFKNQATKAIEDCKNRGRLPILVGGSGLYIDSILYDYSFNEVADESERQRLNNMSLEDLQSEALSKDLPVDSIDSQNKRRVVRLIESNGQIARRNPLRSNTLVLAIDIDRKELRKNVEKRVEAMIKQGLEQEVRQLSQHYAWSTEAMRSIGYREWESYFADQCSLNDVCDAIITHTMQLAKKQRTWFKRNHDICWVNNKNEAVDKATTFMNTFIHNAE